MTPRLLVLHCHWGAVLLLLLMLLLLLRVGREHGLR